MNEIGRSIQDGLVIDKAPCETQVMSDLVFLAVAPAALSMFLVWLRLKRSALWWLSLLIYAALVTLFVLSRARDWQVIAGSLLLYLLPVALMFLGLRLPVFQRRRWLIPPAGIALYLLGLAFSLSINVTAGLIQP